MPRFLLREIRRSGTVSLTTFWGRPFRRLLPALATTPLSEWVSPLIGRRIVVVQTVLLAALAVLWLAVPAPPVAHVDVTALNP